MQADNFNGTGSTRPPLWRRLTARAVIVGVIAALFVAVPTSAQALSGAEFDPGAIISDQEFYDGAAMTEAQIQGFLVAQVGSCANSNCLAAYVADTPTRTWSFGTCSTYYGAPAESAARIIFKVQQACGLSAKVILTTLQKEQSLISDRAPSDGVMRKAMGYGCPDTASCDSTYYGFFNQIFAAARQLTWYSNPAGSFTSIRIGAVNAIRYSPNAACGSKNVLVRNRATAALYYYTPYTPNAAALANLGGIGDGCSAYGNRNFWVFYNNWFGDPTSGSNPVGNIDVVQAQPGHVRVAGWVWDPDTADSTDVHIYINGVGTAVRAANLRPDVGATWPSKGPAHGFDVTLPTTSEGPQTVCIYGINLGIGRNVLFGCPVVPGMTGSPIGALDNVSAAAGTVTVSGWAIDPDTASPTPVHIYVDSAGYAFTANDPRADLASIYPAYGAPHGFSRTVPVALGTHTICAYAIESSGIGANKQIGCRTVNVMSGSPIGVVDTVVATPGAFTVSGWSFDPDSTQSAPVHVYAGANGIAGVADQPRADVAGAYPGYGAAHGYSITVPASPGLNSVCAYGIDIAAPGANKALACRTVAGMSGSPVGVVDSVKTSPGKITVAGWTYDPDTAASIPVHVYVDSAGYAFTADGDRPDLAAAFPAYGSKHGFSVTVSAPPGSHVVCAYGINSGPGGNASVGCSTVNVP